MNRYFLTSAAVAAALVALPATASAHNRAHVILPTGECIIVGSEKSVELPDGTYLDLRPGPGDQIGTSFRRPGSAATSESELAPDRRRPSRLMLRSFTVHPPALPCNAGRRV